MFLLCSSYNIVSADNAGIFPSQGEQKMIITMRAIIQDTGTVFLEKDKESYAWISMNS